MFKTYTDGKKFSKFRMYLLLGKGYVGNHRIKYIFRYLNLITNDSHQCYSIILWHLVPSVHEMSLGVRCKNLDTAQYPVCPPLAANTVRRRLILQIIFLMTCNGVLTHSACKAYSRSWMLLTSWRSFT